MTAQLQLPLLGSNQDSPDPESVVSAAFPVELLGARARIAPESADSTHDFPHGLFHRPRATMSQRRREEWDRLLGAFGYCCAYCGKKASPLYREHMFPKSRGGDDSMENLVPACNRCNTVKGCRTPLEWFLTFDQKKPQRAHRTWPAYDEPCWRCGGPCELRRYTKNGSNYSRCTRCRGERAIDPRLAPSARGRQP